MDLSSPQKIGLKTLILVFKTKSVKNLSVQIFCFRDLKMSWKNCRTRQAIARDVKCCKFTLSKCFTECCL